MFRLIAYPSAPQAVGEPPLFLACSTMFAIREAVSAAREEEGLQGWFRMDAPATAATIRLACEDTLTRKVSVGVVSCLELKVISNEEFSWVISLFVVNSVRLVHSA